MIQRARSAVLLGIHQLTVAAGIVLFPVALLANRAGVRLPLHRLLRELQAASQEPADN